MAPYDRSRQPDDDQEGHVGVQPSLSASVPEEGSPLRNGTVRPNIARQRSSSTQLTRPKLPAWQQGSNARNKNYTILDEDGLEAWDRSHSGSPPPRLSLEGGYSSRSSTSPAQPSDSMTSPDPELAPRKSFKRSITVPTRPRIPGMWGEAPMSNSIGGIAESEVVPAPNRFISNTVRRPYATPGGIRQTLRPSTAPRSLSMSISAGGANGHGRVTSPLTVPSASGSGSSGSNTPEDDDAPAVPPIPRLTAGTVSAVPHTSYQPRTLPLTQSASAGSIASTPAGGLLKQPAPSSRRVSPEPLSAPAAPKAIDQSSMDTTMQMDRAMAQLVSLLKDDSDDEGILAQMEEADNTQTRKRKDPDSDSPQPSQPNSPLVAPTTARQSSTSPQLRPRPPQSAVSSNNPLSLSIQPIPPYRGNRARAPSSAAPSALTSIREREKENDGGHRRPSDDRTAKPGPPPVGKLQPGYSRSAAPLSSREIVSSHRRSPTAPSPATSSSQSSVPSADVPAGAMSAAPSGLQWREGKENRADYVVHSRERERDKEYELGSALAVAGGMPRSSSERERARQQALDYERDRRERERMEYERREREHEREREEHQERERRSRERERERQDHLEQERERGAEDADNEHEHVPFRNQQQTKQQNGPVNAERPAPPPPVLDQRNGLAGASTGGVGARERRYLTVRKRQYMRLECIGRGGSSRVFKAVDESTHKICAIKRVSLERADADTIKGYQNEIQLLLRLKGKPGIIDLVDYESNTRKNFIMLVLEHGEVDFNTLIQQRVSRKFNLHKIGDAWQQMLEAVHVIHEDKIVHSDLKPANFVLVRGELKLIDFGIAKAIANDTTNIQRDQQIGTVNYMSPEAIEETNRNDGKKIMKLGRASDVWSLGCILYQMVYGRPPFHSLGFVRKIQVIPDPTYEIQYPEYSVPLILGSGDTPDQRKEDEPTEVPVDIINSMRMCLVRDPKKRATIPQLQAQAWVTGRDSPDAIPLPKTPPPHKPLLKEDESIISQKNMQQLIKYISQIAGVSVPDEEGMSIELLMNLKSVQRPL